MHKLVESGLRHRRTVVVLALLLLVVGGWQLRQAKTDVLPEFTPPTVEVQTESLGLSALEMEQLITVPLERDFLNGLPFLSTIRSRSVPGLSSVLLVFEPGTSLFTARQLVQERLTLTSELPNVAKPPQMLQAVSSASRVEMIGLSSSTVSPIDMSVLAQFTIVPRLLGVPGVANISIFGARDLQLQVQVDPARLRATGVSLDQVISTTGNSLFVSPLTFLEASTPGAGGFFDTAGQRLGVQHILPIKSPDDLARVAIDESPQLHLGDVAQVVQDHQPLIGDAALRDGPGLVLVVQKLPGANTTEVTEAVNAALGSLKPGLTGIDIDPDIYRPASFVETAGRNLVRQSIVAALLVLVGLGLLLRSWRSMLISVVTVPASIVAAALVLYLRGTTMNAMVMAGLALGVALVLHDGVAVTQAMARRVARRGDNDPGAPSGSESVPAVAAAIADVGRPLAVASLVVAIGLVPVLLLSGLPSKPFLPPIALSYALAVGASLAVALALAPALGALLLRAEPNEETSSDGPLARLLRRGHAAALAPVLRRPALGATFVALVVLALGAVSLTQLHPSLQPSFDETDLVIRWSGPSGIALGEMDRIVGRAATELKAVDGVDDVGSHVGRAIFGDQIVGSNGAETWVAISPDADHEQVVSDVRQIVAGYPGMGHEVLSYFNDQVRSIDGTSGAPLTIRLYGQNLDALQSKGTELLGVLGGIKGVKGARVEAAPEQPTISVSVDLAAAERIGVKPGDVRRAATTLTSGLRVGSLYQDQKVFQVVVVGLPDLAKSLTTIEDLPIGVPSGGQVRLGEVAKVAIQPGLSVIHHDNVARSLDVTAQVQGRDASAVRREAKQRLAGISFPAATSAKVLNDAGARGAANLRLLIAGALAAGIIFLVLQAELESWRLAGLAVLTVPLALVGGAAAAWITGGTLPLGGIVGLFAVGGLAIRGATLLLARLQRVARQRPELSRSDALDHGLLDGCPSLLGGAVLVALAFAPFAIAGRGPGTELLHPMAVVILGGLVTTALATLVVLPAGYLAVATSGGAAVASPEPSATVATPEHAEPEVAPVLETTVAEPVEVPVNVAVGEPVGEPEPTVASAPTTETSNGDASAPADDAELPDPTPASPDGPVPPITLDPPERAGSAAQVDVHGSGTGGSGTGGSGTATLASNGASTSAIGGSTDPSAPATHQEVPDGHV